jgi:hypothetical protein
MKIQRDIEIFKHGGCGGEIPIDLSRLEQRFDIIRIVCPECGEQYLLGVDGVESEDNATFTMYKAFDCEEVARFLEPLLTMTGVPYLITQELVANIKIGKIEPFQRLAKRWLKKNPNEKLENFCKENLIF